MIEKKKKYYEKQIIVVGKFPRELVYKENDGQNKIDEN